VELGSDLSDQLIVVGESFVAVEVLFVAVEGLPGAFSASQTTPGVAGSCSSSKNLKSYFFDPLAPPCHSKPFFLPEPLAKASEVVVVAGFQLALVGFPCLQTVVGV
jgi:hypothetical protein